MNLRQSARSVAPIGLAGGLNLYGFAGGDPVNFSDPFGLRIIYESEEHKRLFMAVRSTFRRIAASGDDRRDRYLAREMVRMLDHLEQSDTDHLVIRGDRDALEFDGGCGSAGCARQLGRLALVRLDPKNLDPTQKRMTTVMAHELGHVYAYRLKGPKPGLTEFEARSTENVYRRGVGMCPRGKGVWPPCDS